jgi:hypothetical protein
MSGLNALPVIARPPGRLGWEPLDAPAAHAFEFALLDPRLRRNFGIIAAYLFDEPLGVSR